MKNIFKITAILLLSIIVLSCSEESELQTNEELAFSEFEFSLISPNGKKLANNEEDLFSLISKETGKSINNETVTINDIKYSENDVSSVAIVDFELNEEFNSMLVILDLNKKFMSIYDNNDLYFVEKSIKNESLKAKDVITVNMSKTALIGGSTLVCNGGCCGWSTPAENHFHCGCPASVILTTSDGCKIQML